MPATPAQQDPLQDSWRIEELTPDVRRRLCAPAHLLRGARRLEGPADVAPKPHSEHPRAH